MAAVQRLCGRCLYIRQGRLISEGPSGIVIDSYLAESATGGGERQLTYARRCADLEIETVEILVNGEVRATVPAGATATIRLRYHCLRPDRFRDGLECGFMIFGHGQKLANFWSNAGLGRTLPAAPRGVIKCTVPDWPFRTMPMSLQVHLNYRRETLVDLPEALIFDSLDSDRFGTGIVPGLGEGIVLLPHQWESTAAG